jgi:hypothetical protein
VLFRVRNEEAKATSSTKHKPIKVSEPATDLQTIYEYMAVWKLILAQ